MYSPTSNFFSIFPPFFCYFWCGCGDVGCPDSEKGLRHAQSFLFEYLVVIAALELHFFIKLILY